MEASQDLGIPIVPHLNSPDIPTMCCGHSEFTVDEKMKRSSTCQAFLPPKIAIERRSNMKICTDALVTRLDIRKGSDGRMKAFGVFFERNSRPTASGGKSDTFYAVARRDIILCCGALGSPQILQLRSVL